MSDRRVATVDVRQCPTPRRPMLLGYRSRPARVEAIPQPRPRPVLIQPRAQQRVATYRVWAELARLGAWLACGALLAWWLGVSVACTLWG